MSRCFLAATLSLAVGSAAASGMSEPSTVEIAIGRHPGRATAPYMALARQVRAHGQTLVAHKTIAWTFRGNSGQFLLAQVSMGRSTSCVVYLLRKGAYVSLGGNDPCARIEDPRLVWSGNKAWLEFPQALRQPAGVPTPINEFTAHFDKATGDMCILGLPPTGYDALRCADDEAPNSK